MEWKNYNEKYLISNCGDVKNIKSEKILKIRTTPEGYVHYSLGGTNKKVHRIVATLFVPNPNNLPCVNHIDGNKLNNSYTNLEWCTQGHNLKESYRLGLTFGPSKKVFAYRNDELVGEYKSQYECARQLGLGLSSVCGSLQSEQPCFGYTFKRA